VVLGASNSMIQDKRTLSLLMILCQRLMAIGPSHQVVRKPKCGPRFWRRHTPRNMEAFIRLKEE